MTIMFPNQASYAQVNTTSIINSVETKCDDI